MMPSVQCYFSLGFDSVRLVGEGYIYLSVQRHLIFILEVKLLSNKK